MENEKALALPSMKLDEKGLMLPSSIDDLWWMAKVFSRPGLCPKAYENKPESVLVAWQMGAELGLTRMASLQGIAVINGMPSVYGDALLAICLTSGELESIEESYEGDQFNKDGKENDNFAAVCTVKTKTGRIVTERFSVRDAKLAKLWGKRGQNGGETPWISYWKRMMKMRARSWALRDAVPQALKGFRVKEEMDDATPDEVKTFTSAGPSASDLLKAAIKTGEPETTSAPPEEPTIDAEATPEQEHEIPHVVEILSDPIVLQLQENIGLTDEEVKGFMEASAELNGIPLPEVIEHMRGNLDAYCTAAIAYFNKKDRDEQDPPVAPPVEPAAEPVKEEPPKAEPESAMDKELKDAAIVLAFQKMPKAAFEKFFANPEKMSGIAKQNIIVRKAVAAMWLRHKLGPCPFYTTETQDKVPEPGKMTLAAVPEPFGKSPDRTYMFALANARKQYPQIAEEARTALGFGHLAKSESQAKLWYEKMVNIISKVPPKTER